MFIFLLGIVYSESYYEVYNRFVIKYRSLELIGMQINERLNEHTIK